MKTFKQFIAEAGGVNLSPKTNKQNVDTTNDFVRGAYNSATMDMGKYARAAVDTGVKNLGAAVGIGKGTTYKDELDDELEKDTIAQTRSPNAYKYGGYASDAVAAATGVGGLVKAGAKYGIKHMAKDILSPKRVGGVYGDDAGQYSVNTLIKRTKNKVPEEIPVKDVISKNKELGTKEGNFADNVYNPNSDFKARASKSNTQYPILTDNDGYIVDGSHRVAKTYWQNPDSAIKAQRLSPADFDAAKIKNPIHKWLASRVK